MSKAKNLELRGSTYYARITTPKTLAELRHQAGRKGAREIKRSLGTGDRRQAEVLLAGFMAEAHQAFAAEETELRAAIAAGMPAKRTGKALAKPSVDDLEHAVLEFKHKDIDSQGRYREAWRDSACAASPMSRQSPSSYFDTSEPETPSRAP